MLSAFSTSLMKITSSMLGKGMLGIFVVLLVIMGVVYLLNYITNKKKNKKDKE